MMGLTLNMKKCLSYITAYIGEHGIAPSYTEIQRAMGLKSKSGVCRLIDSLEARGHVVRNKHLSRSLTLAQPVPPALHAAASRAVDMIDEIIIAHATGSEDIFMEKINNLIQHRQVLKTALGREAKAA